MSIICEELIETNDLHNQLDKYLATVKGHKITNDNASVILNYFDKLRAILTNSLLRNQDLTGRLRQQSELVELINSVRTTKTTTSTDKSVNAVSSNDHTSNSCPTEDPLTIATDSPISPTAANHNNTSSTYSLETIGKTFTTQELDRARTILVTNPPSNPKEIRRILERNIDIHALNIKILQVFYNKNQRLVLKLKNEVQANSLKEIIKTSVPEHKFLVSSPRYLSKKILISRVPKNVSQAEVTRLLAAILHIECKYLSARIIGRRNSSYNSWCCTLPQTLAETLISRKTILFNLSTLFIQPYISLNRCFNCQEYGHLYNHCNNDTCCPNCSLPHLQTDCNNQDLWCINCSYSGLSKDLCGHQASSSSCPTYLRLLQEAKLGSAPIFQRLQVETSNPQILQVINTANYLKNHLTLTPPNTNKPPIDSHTSSSTEVTNCQNVPSPTGPTHTNPPSPISICTVNRVTQLRRSVRTPSQSNTLDQDTQAQTPQRRMTTRSMNAEKALNTSISVTH